MRLAAKGLTAILSIITIGAALSLPISPAFAITGGVSGRRRAAPPIVHAHDGSRPGTLRRR